MISRCLLSNANMKYFSCCNRALNQLTKVKTICGRSSYDTCTLSSISISTPPPHLSSNKVSTARHSNIRNLSTINLNDEDSNIIHENSNQQSIQCYPCHIFFSDTTKEVLQVKLNYPIYKKTAKNAISPHKKGGLLLDLTSSYDNNNKSVIDWKNKSSASLNVEIVGKVLYCLSRHKGIKCEIYNNYDKYRNPKGRIVELILSPKEDGSVILCIATKTKIYPNQKKVDESEEVVDSKEFLLTVGDVEVFQRILKDSIPYIIGWQALLERSLDVSIQNIL